MTELERVLKHADLLVSEARNAASFGERAGIYALAITYAADLKRITDEAFGADGYLHEKVGQFSWHIGAALGFDETNGHAEEMQRGWALGAISSFESRVGNLNDG